MSLLEIILLVIVYLLSSGFLSVMYITNSDDIDPKIATVMLILMFVPGVNTLATLFAVFLSWSEIVFKRKSDG